MRKEDIRKEVDALPKPSKLQLMKLRFQALRMAKSNRSVDHWADKASIAWSKRLGMKASTLKEFIMDTAYEQTDNLITSQPKLFKRVGRLKEEVNEETVKEARLKYLANKNKKKKRLAEGKEFI